MKALITFLFTLAFIATFAQQPQFKEPDHMSDAVRQWMSKVDTAKFIQSYGLANDLWDAAELGELYELTKHPSPMVRCFAFMAMTHYEHDDYLPLIFEHINDTANVTFAYPDGDTEDFMVGDFYIDLLTPGNWKNVKPLTQQQVYTLDSTLAYIPHDIDYLYYKVSDDKGAPGNLYLFLKDAVLKATSGRALVFLAFYKKPEDTSVIFNYKNADEEQADVDRYLAMYNFPHVVFEPFLIARLQERLTSYRITGEWDELYDAIANYRNKEAAQALHLPFEKASINNMPCHLAIISNSIRDAIEGREDTVFDQLLWKMWEQGNMIQAAQFVRLSKSDPARALRLSKKSLADINAFHHAHWLTADKGGEKNEDVVQYMVDYVLKNDKKEGKQLILKNLTIANERFYAFAYAAGKKKDNLYIEPLFERLAKENISAKKIIVAQVLMSYNRKTKERLSELRHNDPELDKLLQGIRPYNKRTN